MFAHSRGRTDRRRGQPAPHDPHATNAPRAAVRQTPPACAAAQQTLGPPAAPDRVFSQDPARVWHALSAARSPGRICCVCSPQRCQCSQSLGHAPASLRAKIRHTPSRRNQGGLTCSTRGRVPQLAAAARWPNAADSASQDNPLGTHISQHRDRCVNGCSSARLLPLPVLLKPGPHVRRRLCSGAVRMMRV